MDGWGIFGRMCCGSIKSLGDEASSWKVAWREREGSRLGGVEIGSQLRINPQCELDVLSSMQSGAGPGHASSNIAASTGRRADGKENTCMRRDGRLPIGASRQQRLRTRACLIRQPRSHQHLISTSASIIADIQLHHPSSQESYCLSNGFYLQDLT